MATPDVYEWQLYCITEGKMVSFFGPTAPTTCPNDTAHEINPDSITQIRKVNSDTIQVTDSSPENGYFQTTSVVIDIPIPTTLPVTIIKEVIFPTDIYISEMSISQDPSNAGDEIKVEVNPGATLSPLMADAAIGATVLTLVPQAIAFVVKGLDVSIDDGKVEQRLGRIMAIDTTAFTITVEFPLTEAHTATASLVKLYVTPVRNMVTDYSSRLSIGNKGLKTTLIKAGYAVRVTYTDRTPNTKATAAYFSLQYYY